MSKRRWNDVNEVLDILFSNNIEELAELAELADVELGGDDAELEEDIAESGSDEYDDDDYDPIENLHGSPKAEDVYAEYVEICVPNAIATFKLTQPEPKTSTTNLLPDNFDMDPYMDIIPDTHNIVVHTDHNVIILIWILIWILYLIYIILLSILTIILILLLIHRMETMIVYINCDQ